jgi:uncharacterized protein YbaA (DUF1428 family)
MNYDPAGAGGPARRIPRPDGLVMTAAVAEFRSRAHRDEVMGKVMQDEHVTTMTEADEITDMSRMRYGGFETFVDP